jgi:hypothetical protein
MASGRYIAWAAIGLLWVLAVWHSWVSRGLFVDGSKLLIDMVRYEWFVTFRGPRFHTEVSNQILPVIGIKLGVTDLHLLARLLSFDLFCVPTLFYSLALWRAHRDAVVLAAVLAAVGIVFMTTSFFIVGEYNTTYALTVMGAVWLVTSDRLRLGDGIVLLAVAIFLLRSYEVTLFLGPLMAVMIFWRVASATSQSRIAGAVHLAAGLLFLGGMFVAVGSLLHPFDPEHLQATYLELAYFWWNLPFDLACAAAAVVVVWALVRPDSLGQRTPFLWASILLALLALSPLLALADFVVQPTARSQYISRFAGGAVVAAIVLFMWAHASGLHRKLPALAMLRRPDVGRRFLVFATLLLAAGVPIDLQLTAGWLHYLDTLKSIVRTHAGVVAIEDTALARKPDLLLVENWSMPSQSLVLRSKPGDGVVAPFRWYTGWSPFPPENPLDLGSYAWRD